MSQQNISVKMKEFKILLLLFNFAFLWTVTDSTNNISWEYVRHVKYLIHGNKNTVEYVYVIQKSVQKMIKTGINYPVFRIYFTFRVMWS